MQALATLTGRTGRALLRALLRGLALVLALQLTAAAHAALDFVTALESGSAVHEETCPIDRPCDDCPPGCPSCHCTGSARSVAPGRGPLLSLAAPPGARVELPEASSAPRAPEPTLFFRPPRS